jgi:phosphoribosylformylglycinamidine synthase
VKLSCNWMAACGEPGEDAALYDTVRAVGMELCPALGISVPVGKDSLSMRTRWRDDGRSEAGHRAGEPDRQRLRHAGRRARHADAATAARRHDLILIDLGQGRNRMAGSMLAQVLGQFGDEVPDLDDPGAC